MSTNRTADGTDPAVVIVSPAAYRSSRTRGASALVSSPARYSVGAIDSSAASRRSSVVKSSWCRRRGRGPRAGRRTRATSGTARARRPPATGRAPRTTPCSPPRPSGRRRAACPGTAAAAGRDPLQQGDHGGRRVVRRERDVRRDRERASRPAEVRERPPASEEFGMIRIPAPVSMCTDRQFTSTTRPRTPPASSQSPSRNGCSKSRNSPAITGRRRTAARGR